MGKNLDAVLQNLLPFDLIYYNGPWWDIPCLVRRVVNKMDYGGVAILGYSSMVYTFGLVMGKQKFQTFLKGKTWKIQRAGRVSKNMAQFSTHILEQHQGAFIPCWPWLAKRVKKIGVRLWPISAKPNIPYHICHLVMIEWVYLRLLRVETFHRLQTVAQVNDNH